MVQNDIYSRIDEITQRVLNGGEMTADEGRWMITLEHSYLPWVMAGADRLRRTFRGDEIESCAISNVRSGNCSEDCSFCSQSAHHKETQSPAYDYISADELKAQALRAREWGVSDFGIVSKGWGVRNQKEQNKMTEYFETLSEESDIGRCASLGVLTKESASKLKEAGLENYHHNLEAAESFFDNVCSTHTYQENIDTIKHAADAGLRVCAGGILGMGESLDQRIELADTLRKIGVESVPMNFLSPAAGTPMQDVPAMQPHEILLSIATYRYMLPKAEIRIAGGRQHLRDMQSMIFFAGASGIMVGDYLTTSGRSIDDDLNMLKDLKLTMRGDTQKSRKIIPISAA